MADFSFIEKNRFEKLFGMGTGYVLNFSDRTFQEFVGDIMGVDIYDEKYNYKSGSKANRLRGYWAEESNYNIGKLLEKMLELWLSLTQTGELEAKDGDTANYEECLKIVAKLKADSPITDLAAIQPNSEDATFAKLAAQIKESIEKNEPENALDRLHTFTIKYVRQLCDNNEITYDKETPLHSLFGCYVKHLNAEGLIESKMTERILKSSISVLEAFNHVRNNQSFAHDNTILNYNESILIFNNISNVVRFLESIEKPTSIDDPVDEWDNLPF